MVRDFFSSTDKTFVSASFFDKTRRKKKKEKKKPQRLASMTHLRHQDEHCYLNRSCRRLISLTCLLQRHFYYHFYRSPCLLQAISRGLAFWVVANCKGFFAIPRLAYEGLWRGLTFWAACAFLVSILVIPAVSSEALWTPALRRCRSH